MIASKFSRSKIYKYNFRDQEVNHEIQEIFVPEYMQYQ